MIFILQVNARWNDIATLLASTKMDSWEKCFDVPRRFQFSTGSDEFRGSIKQLDESKSVAGKHGWSVKITNLKLGIMAGMHLAHSTFPHVASLMIIPDLVSCIDMCITSLCVLEQSLMNMKTLNTSKQIDIPWNTWKWDKMGIKWQICLGV